NLGVHTGALERNREPVGEERMVLHDEDRCGARALIVIDQRGGHSLPPNSPPLLPCATVGTEIASRPRRATSSKLMKPESSLLTMTRPRTWCRLNRWARSLESS